MCLVAQVILRVHPSVQVEVDHRTQREAEIALVTELLREQQGYGQTEDVQTRNPVLGIHRIRSQHDSVVSHLRHHLVGAQPIALPVAPQSEAIGLQRLLRGIGELHAEEDFPRAESGKTITVRRAQRGGKADTEVRVYIPGVILSLGFAQLAHLVFIQWNLSVIGGATAISHDRYLLSGITGYDNDLLGVLHFYGVNLFAGLSGGGRCQCQHHQ